VERNRQEVEHERRVGEFYHTPPYSNDFPRQARELCNLGASDVELADFFRISVRLLHLWMVQHPEFGAAVHDQGEYQDKRVRRTLYQRALGFYVQAEKVFLSKEGEIVRTTIQEYVPPDPACLKFWLTNRQPADWKERSDDDGGRELVIRVKGGLPE
jgi:hypothetical protein